MENVKQRENHEHAWGDYGRGCLSCVCGAIQKMENVKFTKGPWEFTREESGYFIDKENGGPIAQVYERPKGQATYNARLIAESPNLLHELERASHALGLVIETAKGKYSPDEIALIQGYKRCADAAIAKAEGREGQDED